MFLSVGVVVLGLAAYLASFGPLLSLNADIGPFGGAQFTASGLSYWTVAALVAALLAAVGLLPKSKAYTAIVAVAAVLGVLLVLGQAINRPDGFSIGWALWLVLAFTLLQAIAAVAAMLFDSGGSTPAVLVFAGFWLTLPLTLISISASWILWGLTRRKRSTGLKVARGVAYLLPLIGLGLAGVGLLWIQTACSGNLSC
jgi:hypothetical protein